MVNDPPRSLFASAPRRLLWLAALWLLAWAPDGDGFPAGFHGYLSSHGAAITANLSPEHGWLMFERRILWGENDLRYSPYNRFPGTTFLILRAATLPVAADPGAALVIMHQVMNLFLIATLFTVARTLRRIGMGEAPAAAATLLVFSSFYLLYFGDMVFVDTPTLFGCALALEGMAIHATRGGTRGLLARAVLGTLFGWQVLAFLLPYTAAVAFRGLRESGWRPLPHNAGIRTGLAALATAALLLVGNLWNEHRMTGLPYSELDTLTSAEKRLGTRGDWNEQHAAKLAAGHFLGEQLRRIGRAVLPHPLPPWPSKALCQTAGLFALVLGATFASRSPFPLLSWTALSAGLVWALPMKHFVAFHEFQAIYFFGIPLVIHAHALAWLDSRRPRLATLATGCAALLFALACVHVTRTKVLQNQDARALTEDFRAITAVLPPGAVFFSESVHPNLAFPAHGVDYYMAGHPHARHRHMAPYRLHTRRDAYPELLTPGNRLMFAFRADGTQE